MKGIARRCAVLFVSCSAVTDVTAQEIEPVATRDPIAGRPRELE